MKLTLAYGTFIFIAFYLAGCVTPMYYSDKLSTPIITDSTNTSIDFNSGYEVIQRTKWILKSEITHAVVKNIFIATNAKFVKGFSRDPMFGSIGASIGLYSDFSKDNTTEAVNAQIQVIAGYDQGRNIGTFKDPPITGERERDGFFHIDVDNDLLISVFAIRRFFQLNYVLNLSSEDQLILSYRHSYISNSRFSLLNDYYIYDENTIYHNGSSATLYEPAVSFLTGKGVKFCAQIGKIFGAEGGSFAVSQVFLAFGTQYGF